MFITLTNIYNCKGEVNPYPVLVNVNNITFIDKDSIGKNFIVCFAPNDNIVVKENLEEIKALIEKAKAGK